MALQLNPSMRDNGPFFDQGKSYARRAEALRRLITCADQFCPEGQVFDYIIWTTPAGRFVPVWIISQTHATHALDAIDLGVMVFRR